MSKKPTKNKNPNSINVGERRTVKKKVEQRIPFDRIKLHPVEELEAEMIALAQQQRQQQQQQNWSSADSEQVLRTTAPETTTAAQETSTGESLAPAAATSTTDLTAAAGKTSTGVRPAISSETRTSELSAANTTRTSESAASASKTSTTKRQKIPFPPSVLGQPVAPTRDFQKVPNSIARDALPAKLFRGKSKLVWDYLWSITRGAIKATRTVRRSRREIMRAAGIGSLVTVDAALLHLESVGLLRKFSAVGSPTGNEYEIIIPEEINPIFLTADTCTSYTSTASCNLYQKLVQPPIPETSIGGISEVVENEAGCPPRKTTNKTDIKNDDDKRFASLTGFFQIFDVVFKELTGKGIEQTDADSLKQIAELLAAELREARTKTKTISRPAAFLARHLKGRLSKPVRAPKTADSVKPRRATDVKPDLVGKSTDPSERIVDLTDYSDAEIEELKREFCLQCGKLLDECICAMLAAAVGEK